MAIAIHPSFAIHVGRWVRTEIIDASGFSIGETAEALGVSRQALGALLNGRSSMSPSMALRLEKAFGVSADTLMRMQARYRIAEARRSMHPVRRMVSA